MILGDIHIDTRKREKIPSCVERTKMALTNRYFVLKGTDVFNSLTPEEISQLTTLCEKINKHREQRGAVELNGVFIEADWPVFDTTVELLEKRIKEETTMRKFTSEELLKVTGVNLDDVTVKQRDRTIRDIVIALQLTEQEKLFLKNVHDNGPFEDNQIQPLETKHHLEELGMIVPIRAKDDRLLNACSWSGHEVLRLVKYMDQRSK